MKLNEFLEELEEREFEDIIEEQIDDFIFNNCNKHKEFSAYNFIEKELKGIIDNWQVCDNEEWITFCFLKNKKPKNNYFDFLDSNEYYVCTSEYQIFILFIFYNKYEEIKQKYSLFLNEMYADEEDKTFKQVCLEQIKKVFNNKNKTNLSIEDKKYLQKFFKELNAKFIEVENEKFNNLFGITFEDCKENFDEDFEGTYVIPEKELIKLVIFLQEIVLSENKASWFIENFLFE